MTTIMSTRDENGEYFYGEIVGNTILVLGARQSRFSPEYNYLGKEICLGNCCYHHEEERIRQIITDAKYRGVERISHRNNGSKKLSPFCGLPFDKWPTDGAG